MSKRKKRKKEKFLNKFQKVLICLVLILTATLFFQQINLISLASQISKNEKESSKITYNIRRLESKYLQTFSFKNFDQVAQSLNFEKIDNVSYIKLRDTAVARINLR
jgi:hypothetical protein